MCVCVCVCVCGVRRPSQVKRREALGVKGLGREEREELFEQLGPEAVAAIKIDHPKPAVTSGKVADLLRAPAVAGDKATAAPPNVTKVEVVAA